MGRKNKRRKIRKKRLPAVYEINGGQREPRKPADSSRMQDGGSYPKRMEVWYANLPLDTNTSVQGGTRPVLIMSNDVGNRTSRTVTVLPMTSKLKHPNMPTHVYMPGKDGLERSSMILAEQITTVDKSALDRKLADCAEPSMVRQVEAAVSEQLGLNGGTDMDYIMSRKSLDSCTSICEYLDSLPVWDGKNRTETLLRDYLGAEDNIYTRAVSRKMLVAAISRAMEPGCTANFLPILWGESGSGKSLFLDCLAGTFKGDAFSWDAESRLIVVPGEEAESWILEIAEHLPPKNEVGYLKQFIHRDTDEIGYIDMEDSMTLVKKKRSFLPVWTTNEDCSDFIADGVLWPVQVHRDRKRCAVFYLDRITVDQLWAEAKKLYKDNEPLTLDAEAFSVYTELYGKGKADEAE